jgi:hypothetical protein
MILKKSHSFTTTGHFAFTTHPKPHHIGGSRLRRTHAAAPADDRLWRMSHPDKKVRPVNHAGTLHLAALSCARRTHPGIRRARCAGTPHSVCRRQRRHPIRGRPRRDRTLGFRLPRIFGVHSGQPAKLPADTVVYPGHGESTTIGEESCSTRNGFAAAIETPTARRRSADSVPSTHPDRPDNLEPMLCRRFSPREARAQAATAAVIVQPSSRLATWLCGHRAHR